MAWLDPVASSPIEVAAGAFIITGLGLVAMVWGAAIGSSWLINGEAADVGVSEAGRALVRFGTNGLQWDDTWSEPVKDSLAGPLWFWIFFAVEVAIVALLFWPAWRLLGPRVADPLSVVIEEAPPKHPRAERRQAARAARARSRRIVPGRDLVAPPIAAPTVDRLFTSDPGGRRLVLGRSGRRLVATDGYHSVLVFGPTRSGKTSSLTVPALLEWDGPALVVSSKSDVVSLAWRERAKVGQAWLFDPTSSMAQDEPGFQARRPATSTGWSPLHMISAVPQPRNEPALDRLTQQWGLARRTAQWMVGAARLGDATREVPEAWFVAAEQFLAPVLLAAAAEELPIGQVAEWIERGDRGPVDEALRRSEVTEAIAAWDGAHNYDATTEAGSYQILAMIMLPYGDPKVLRQARNPEITARGLLDGERNTLFVLAPPNHEDWLRPLLTTLVSEVLDTAIGNATGSPAGRLATPLLVAFDDAEAAAPHQLIDHLASAGAGLGIQLLSLVQDLGQMERTFGREPARRLANNHRAKVLLPGVGDAVTLDYVNSIIRGTRLVQPSSTDDDLGDDPLVAGSGTWMRTLGDGDALCVYANLPPLRMTLRPWFDEPALHDLIHPPPERPRRFWQRRRRELVGGGFPNPLDSDGNDRESARYWDAIVEAGVPPEPRPFDDGSSPGSS